MEVVWETPLYLLRRNIKKCFHWFSLGKIEHIFYFLSKLTRELYMRKDVELEWKNKNPSQSHNYNLEWDREGEKEDLKLFQKKKVKAIVTHSIISAP